MSDLLNLDLLDVDGAIRESAEAAGFDRSSFLKKGALAGGGIIAGGAFFSQLGVAEAAISSKKSKKNDVKILNYALTLEYLESAFYNAAVANAAYGDDANLKKFAETVAKHEAAHVKFLKGALEVRRHQVAEVRLRHGRHRQGDVRRDRPGPRGHRRVTAYLGQVANIFQGAVLGAAGTIATVEARHAAWIRFINGDTPAPASLRRPQVREDHPARPSAARASSSSTTRTGSGDTTRGPAGPRRRSSCTAFATARTTGAASGSPASTSAAIARPTTTSAT